MSFDFSKVEALRTAARRERSQYVYCLLLRAKVWLLGLVHSNATSDGPCCEPA
jgi:hypothetical protein